MSDIEPVSGEFSVEHIVYKRLINGKVEYFLKWKGRPHSENTWVSEEKLGCADLIAAYEQFIKPRTSDPKKRSWTTLSRDEKTKRKQAERNQADRKQEKDNHRKTGFDRGLEPSKILRATEFLGEQMFLVKWEGSDETELVAAKEAYTKCPQIVLKFYEEKLTLDKPNVEECKWFANAGATGDKI